MGSPDGECPDEYPAAACINEPEHEPDEELHYVTLTNDFEIQKYEVTQGEWNVVVESWNPSWHKECGDECPVECVSWFQALAYANMKSVQAGLAPCYALSDVTCVDEKKVGFNYQECMNETQGGVNEASIALAGGAGNPYECKGYRLPTEAEWEYAARAGSLTSFHPSPGNDGMITVTGFCPLELDPNLDQIAVYCANSPGNPTAVGSKEPNEWGLYDMIGNVSEWCWDRQLPYAEGPATDPAVEPLDLPGNLTAWKATVRAGCFAAGTSVCRSASRMVSMPWLKTDVIGFRLVRTL